MDGELEPGARFAGCRIEAVAGRGGMGVVYRATELALGRPVALKVVAPARAADPTFGERFGREARLAAAIEHPNVVPVYAAGEEDGRLFLVMRHVEGTDLHRLLRDEGAPGARPARRRSSSRWRPGSMRRMRPGSCIATSSRPTSSSGSRAAASTST